jgi:LmbE family N-acetylglucosaminyl deacetylase
MFNTPANPQTLLFVHAHPDDEALLTAGTMARARAEGHRVLLLVATDGAAGLTSGKFADSLGSVRQLELELSAEILGVDKVISWAYPDSGLHAENLSGFAHMNIESAAKTLIEIIDEEQVSVLIGYDPSGGYGHPDHLQIHRVVREAHRRLSGSCTLFEATLPREPIATTVNAAARMHLTPPGFNPREFEQAWTPRKEITHRVNVRPFLDQKRAAIQAHASQAHADGTVRTLAVLSNLPRPLFAAFMGTEYFVKVR